MGMHYEWDDADAEIGWSHPGHDDAPYSDEGLKNPVLVIGGGGGGAMVIEDTKERLVAWAKRLLAVAEAIDWTRIEYTLDLGIRDTPTGHLDSIKLIHTVLKDHAGLDDETMAKLNEKINSDIIEIEDSGFDLDTLGDLLAEWEQLAEEHDLYAYADEGTYWVTNVPEDD